MYYKGWYTARLQQENSLEALSVWKEVMNLGGRQLSSNRNLTIQGGSRWVRLVSSEWDTWRYAGDGHLLCFCVLSSQCSQSFRPPRLFRQSGLFSIGHGLAMFGAIRATMGRRHRPKRAWISRLDSIRNCMRLVLGLFFPFIRQPHLIHLTPP